MLLPRYIFSHRRHFLYYRDLPYVNDNILLTFFHQIDPIKSSYWILAIMNRLSHWVWCGEWPITLRLTLTRRSDYIEKSY